MKRLLRSELRKLATLKTPMVFVGAAITINVLGLIALMTDDSAVLPKLVDDLAFFTWKPVLVAMFVAGAWWVTDEYRHALVGPTFLLTPRRTRVLVAKLLVLPVVAGVVSLIAESAFVAVAIGWVDARGVTVALQLGEVAAEIVRSSVAASLWAGLGVAIGTIVRSQAAALTVGLIWALVGEDVASLFVGSGLEYLPVHASDAFVRASGEGWLSIPAGGIVFAAYALAAGLGAAILIRRRDVT